MTGQDAYYHLFRNLKDVAAAVYNPTRLQEAKDLEDVALVIRYSFDEANRAAVAAAMGIENINQFCGLLEFAAAIARIQRQVQAGGW
jgi:nucleoid-associated protein YgaU